MQELSIINVFNGEERLPEDLRLRDVVRRVWASPVATTLRRKRGGLDSVRLPIPSLRPARIFS